MKPSASFREAYRSRIRSLLRGRDGKVENDGVGLSEAVGGNFSAIGYLEKRLLLQHGLKSGHKLVDVGCGSGRLVSQLEAHDVSGYLGTDISQELLDSCRRYLKGENWSVSRVENCSIPKGDESCEMVCMFSVITHLLHQESYLYFCEAARVLRPGGRLVVSFLEYRHPGLWPVFEASMTNVLEGNRLDMFVDRDGLDKWANHAGLQVVEYIDGEKPHIKIERPVEFDNGMVVEGYARLGPIGQSVAVFEKPHLHELSGAV